MGRLYDMHIGDVTMYGNEVIRLTTCFRCKYMDDYGYDKKCFCRKTKRRGKISRALFCKRFKSNSDSYKDPYLERG